MADRAPGQEPPKSGAACYNCGSKDHLVFACPEPTRTEPAGLEAFRRQRQTASQTNGAGGKSSHAKSKGPIITRYGPPPRPPRSYSGWTASPPVPQGAPYPSSLPSPSFQPPPPSSYYPGAPPPPSYPPYAQQSGFAPGYPAPTAPPNPPYNQYRQISYQPPPQPPAPAYSPPAPYNSATYQPPYPPPPAGYPNPPPSYQGPPPPGPPAPVYGGPPPPAPPNSYPPPPYGQYPPSYCSDGPPPNYQPPANWQPSLNGQNSHRRRDYGGRRQQRGHGNQRHRGLHRSSSASKQRSRDRTPQRSYSPLASPASSVRTKPEEPTAEPDEYFQWEREKIFLELETKLADPVGRPLPFEWNDDPTIPPAFDAKCVKSSFFNESDQASFSLPIRGTKYWDSMKSDPVFKHRPGMTTVRFSGSKHEYFTYHVSKKLSPDVVEKREVLIGPSDATLVDCATKPPTSQRPGPSTKTEWKLPPQANRNGKRVPETLNGYGDRDVKRRREEPLPEKPPPPLARMQSKPNPEADLTGDPRDPRPGKSYLVRVEPRDRSRQPLDDSGRKDRRPAQRTLDRYESPHGPKQRHDSGYQSGYSADRNGTPLSKRSNRQSIPPYQRGRDRERRRPSPYSKTRSSSQSRSRSTTRTPLQAPAGHDSGSDDSMSDLDYDLLGLERPEESDKKKKAPVRPPARRRQVPLNNAFSRRW